MRQVTIVGVPILLAPASPGRMEVRLKVIGAGPGTSVFLGADASVSYLTGYPLFQAAENGYVSIPAEGEIWGTRQSAGAVTVGIMEIVP
jgi:hypothetical protein